MSILISFLNLLLYIAIILLVAYIILWVVRDWFGVAIDPMVLKFAKIIVALLCLIAVVVWIAGVIGGGPHLPSIFHYR
jgi:predicted Co/Zn/Cd cation transporter (cation efflux family)